MADFAGEEKKRIVFVNTWFAHSQVPDLYFEYEAQKLFLAARDFGWHAVGLIMGTPGLLRDTSSCWVDSFGSCWDWIPCEEDSDEIGWRIHSKALMDRLHRDAPDVVVVRVINSKLGKAICRGPWLTVNHVGGSLLGVNYLPALWADVNLVETPEQQLLLSRIVGAENVYLLRKQIPEHFINSFEEKQFDVVVVSHFLLGKNHQALEPLVKTGLRIAIVGDGPLLEEFQERWAVYSNANFLGQLPSVEVARVLKSSRVLVHPSNSEGLPRSIVEALASGLPVVALAKTVQWPIADRANGRLVGEDELCVATLETLNSPDLDKVSAEARRVFDREFSEAQFLSTFKQALMRLENLLQVERGLRRSVRKKITIVFEYCRPFVISRLLAKYLVRLGRKLRKWLSDRESEGKEEFLT